MSGPIDPTDALPPLSPEEEAALDAALSGLPDRVPPPALVADTLAAMDALVAAATPSAPQALPPSFAAEAPEPAPANRRWWGGAAAALLAAGALMVAIPGETPPPDPATLVERGVGDRLPDVSLKVAVQRDGRVDRLSRDGAYGPGDTLYFRAAVDDRASLTLVRVDAVGATVFHQQPLAPGEADLALDDGPLAWRLEPGEGDAVFAVLAAPAPLDAAAVEAALSGAYTGAGAAAAVCQRARSLDARCAAEIVRIAP